MNIRKRLVLLGTALLAIPIGVTALLLRIMYYRIDMSGNTAVIDSSSPASIFDVLIGNYSLALTVLALFGIITIIITGMLFMRGLLRPIKKLTEAARQIERGNLDFAISYDKKDEFLPVFTQFDRMRVKLKDSLWQQIKDEESRVEMIANIAHDLRTPITSIQGYAQGLIDGVAKTEEKKQKYLETIMIKSHELNKMSESLSAFARVGDRKVNIDMSVVNAQEYIGAELTEMSMGLDLADVSYEIDVSVETRINIDVMQVKRVFSNIVQNSMKYKTDDRAKLNIRSYENENYVVICFADQGTGVRESELTTIFNRFYRGDQARKDTSTGSGLGLAIAKQIILLHKGHIWARHNYPHGIKILVSFPKVKPGGDGFAE